MTVTHSWQGLVHFPTLCPCWPVAMQTAFARALTGGASTAVLQHPWKDLYSSVLANSSFTTFCLYYSCACLATPFSVGRMPSWGRGTQCWTTLTPTVQSQLHKMTHCPALGNTDSFLCLISLFASQEFWGDRVTPVFNIEKITNIEIQELSWLIRGRVRTASKEKKKKKGEKVLPNLQPRSHFCFQKLWDWFNFSAEVNILEGKPTAHCNNPEYSCPCKSHQILQEFDKTTCLRKSSTGAELPFVRTSCKGFYPWRLTSSSNKHWAKVPISNHGTINGPADFTCSLATRRAAHASLFMNSWHCKRQVLADAGMETCTSVANATALNLCYTLTCLQTGYYQQYQQTPINEHFLKRGLGF